MRKFLSTGFVIIALLTIASIVLIISPNMRLQGGHITKTAKKTEKSNTAAPVLVAPPPPPATAYTENFDNGCANGCLANGWNGWEVYDFSSGASPNKWYISTAERGANAPNCGGNSGGTDGTLHIGNPTADIGATYVDTAPINATFSAILSPPINITGYTSPVLTFDYFSFGSTSCATDGLKLSIYSFDPSFGDYSDLAGEYCLTSPNSCGGYSNTGTWTTYTLSLASVPNPNIKIAFQWQNDGNGVAVPPAAAIDDIKITGDLPARWFRSTGNTSFASATNWQSSTTGATWSAAVTPPTSAALFINVRNGHTTTVTANTALDQITVENGGTLQVNTGVTFTIADDTGTDLTVQNGGTLNIQGTGTLAGAGSFALDAGGTFRTANVNGFSAIGVSGTKTFTAGANYLFNGTALQTINNPTGLSANNFTINNIAGATLSQHITITGALTLTAGDFNLNGRNVDLGTTGSLSEDRANNHLVVDNTIGLNETTQGGYLRITNRVTTGTLSALAGLGIQLANAGTVSIDRYHYKGTNVGNGGIKKIYDITGTPTNATMRIEFAADELAGVTPSNTLRLFRYNGSAWQNQNGTWTDAVVDYVEATSINTFSPWTVGGNAPLPITLLGLKGERVEGLRGEMTEEVRLEWSTASEINNKGFEIQVSDNAQTYKTIAFVEGKGNSTAVSSYQLAVNNASDSYYRLRQVDFDGTFSYSPVVFVEGMAGKVVVYPNPSNGIFTISVGKEKLESPARLLNAQGIESPLTPEGGMFRVKANLPAGLYFLHTVVVGKAKITKIVIQ